MSVEEIKLYTCEVCGKKIFEANIIKIDYGHGNYKAIGSVCKDINCFQDIVLKKGGIIISPVGKSPKELFKKELISEEIQT